MTDQATRKPGKCCKIGCENEMRETRYITYRNVDGNLMRVNIGWCIEHAPEYILEEYNRCEILKGYGY